MYLSIFHKAIDKQSTALFFSASRKKLLKIFTGNQKITTNIEKFIYKIFDE